MAAAVPTVLVPHGRRACVDALPSASATGALRAMASVGVQERAEAATMGVSAACKRVVILAAAPECGHTMAVGAENGNVGTATIIDGDGGWGMTMGTGTDEDCDDAEDGVAAPVVLRMDDGPAATYDNCAEGTSGSRVQSVVHSLPFLAAVLTRVNNSLCACCRRIGSLPAAARTRMA